MMKSRILLGVLGLTAWMVTASAGADPVYRWTDDTGVVNYGSAPPPAGATKTTVRQIDVTPAVTDVATPDELRARHDLAQVLFAADEARLKRELLEEQIASEHARAQAYKAQADMFAAQGDQGATQDPCAGSGDCGAYPGVFIARGPQMSPLRPFRPHVPPFAHVRHEAVPMSLHLMHPMGARATF